MALTQIKGEGLVSTYAIGSEGGAVTTSIQQGVAKAWANLDGTGTIALRDSVNVGSATDNGNGDYTINFTNSMNNNDYSVPMSSGDSAKSYPRLTACGTNYDTGFATSSHGITCLRADNGVIDDMEFVVSAVMGDLA